MKIIDLRTNHFVTPLGAHLYRPIFSWVTEDTLSKKQTAAQITVKAGDKAVFNSGIREDISSTGFEADIKLLPRTRYSWTVKIWGDNGDSAEASSWFETAKEDEPWEAKWISASFDKKTHPLLTREFCLEKTPVNARVYLCGLGMYELYINGEKAGDEYLLPGYHCYDRILEYQTFDVTSMLSKGKNVIGASLAPGWYMGEIIWDNLTNTYGDTMKLICELHIDSESGHEVIATDSSWICRESPITHSSINHGEHYDAQKQIADWARADCGAPYSPSAVLSDGTELLHARLSPKIVKKQKFSPVEVIHTKKGETVLDFGQNMTGWVEFDVDIPKGSQVKLSYGEVMQEGCFYRDNLRTAKCEYSYISDGNPAHARPHFTFYGFRYVKVEGLGNLEPSAFTAWHIRSDIDPIGRIETDNPDVNQLFSNAMWGQFDNFLDVPTDCPQRDERLGWTGDAAIISQTACKNIYSPAFFHHFINNIALEQAGHDGVVPFYVPALGDFGYNWGGGIKGGCAIWSDAAAMIPWAVYENYGDIHLLRREYNVMRDWVEAVRRNDKAHGNRRLWLGGKQLGDWLALDTDNPQSSLGATDLTYTASCFYHYSSLLTHKAAKALGYMDDAEEYGALAKEIREAVIKEFWDESGNFKIEGTQTACVLSLFFNIYPEGCKDKVLAQLRKRIEAKNTHLDTGFCGTPFLCRVLSDNGASDLAYSLFLNTDFPSWLFEVKMGATTIWERWNSILPDGTISGTGMNSLNHYAYGSIVDWMYRNLCGISPCEEKPGYKKVVIRPAPDSRIGFAKADMNTASGKYQVHWKHEGNEVKYFISVPFDCEAELILPDGAKHHLTAGSYNF